MAEMKFVLDRAALQGIALKLDVSEPEKSDPKKSRLISLANKGSLTAKETTEKNTLIALYPGFDSTTYGR